VNQNLNKTLKKMMLLALSVGALVAFMAPAVAQADIELTGVDIGEEITATSLNFSTTFWGSVFNCAKVTLHLRVEVSSSEHILLAPTSTATTKGCAVAGALPTTFTDWTLLEDLTIDTWGAGEVTVEFTSHIVFPPLGIDITNCHNGGIINLQGSNGSSSLTLNPSALTGGGGGGCPEETTMSGSFSLENGAAELVVLDSVDTP
jgi:hypothetical protein